MSPQLPSHENVITAARQTMTAWSKVIESPDDIPALYRSHFDKEFGHQPFPHVILTPSLEKFPRKSTEKLICDTADALHIFEKNGNQVDAKCYRYRDIYGSETGIVLLDSWVMVHGKTRNGESATSKIEVNTTSLRYFAGIQRKLRPSLDATNTTQFSFEKDKFNALSKVHFKFMNYGRESLIPGETVLQLLLQQEIREPLFALFGKTFYKNLSPAHLIVLTDHELILLQDVERNKDSKISQYGGLWQYIPLHCIKFVDILEAAANRLTLSIQCQPGRTIETLFDASSRSELEQFRSRLQTLK